MSDELFHIESKSPAAADMMFWRIVGHETFSRASTYELTVLSTDHQLHPGDILGHAFDVVIDFFDADGKKHERHCQGHAVRFMRAGRLGRYFEYRIVLRSWFWLLTKRINSRILQDMDVLKIADEVFNDSPIKTIKKINDEGVTEKHKSRHYCVQYQESDYQYLSRLLEDEGIYYWFDVHDTDDALGTMRLSDTSSVPHTPLPANNTLEYTQGNSSEVRYNSIVRWIDSYRLDSGRYASRDVDYLRINAPLSIDVGFSQNHELADFEVFEYPGDYLTIEQRDNVLNTRTTELYARYELNWALTHWHDVGVGHTFTFEGNPNGTTSGYGFLIAACTFVVSHPGYEGLPAQDIPQRSVTTILREALADDAVNAHRLNDFVRLIDNTPELRTDVRGINAFLITTLPVVDPFKPPRLTPRVTMPGPQSAIVVGPEGEELDVDEDGRVRVQFHWDRYAEKNEKKENSTCRIRVSQPWAGKGWGGYFMPRIGQEVLVDFVNGDPDQPIIVGRMYNNDQPIPYKSATQSGFKTRSTKKGTPNNYNEIMFEDKKGGELLNVQAERNMDTLVKNDQTTTVKGKQTVTVTKDQSITVEEKGNQRVTLKEGNQFITVKKGQQAITDEEGNQFITAKKGQQSITAMEGAQEIIATKGQQSITATEGNQFITATKGEQAITATEGNQFITATKGAQVITATKGNQTIEASDGEQIIIAKKNQYINVTDDHILTATNITQGATANMELLSNNKLLLSGMNETTITGAQVNVTSLGPQKGASVGMFSKTIMGMENTNNLGLVSQGVLGLKLESILGLSLLQQLVQVNEATFHTFKLGAGGTSAPLQLGGGSATGIARFLRLALPALFQGGTAIHDSWNGLERQSSNYQDAANRVAEAAIKMEKLSPGLSGSLKELSGKLEKRASEERTKEIVGGAVAVGVPTAIVGGLVAVPAGALAVGVLGTTGAAVGGISGAAIEHQNKPASAREKTEPVEPAPESPKPPSPNPSEPPLSE